MDDLLATFLPRFRTIAAERLTRLRAQFDGGLARRELHALAGEASMLGLGRVAELARSAETRWVAGGWTTREEWSAALDALSEAIDADPPAR